MTRGTVRPLPVLLLVLPLTACGESGGPPAGPSAAPSFLAGTWRGTLTVQPDPTGPHPGPPVSGPVTWVFEVVPQTNRQAFRTTIRSENGWLPITLLASTSMIPGNTPPAQISTQGEYDSPRGCRGTFGSFATADARTHSGQSSPGSTARSRSRGRSR